MNYKLIITGLISIVLVACGAGKSSDLQDAIETTPNKVLFDPNPGGSLPWPNNLLFSGSSDGTLNIPVDGDATDSSNPVVALNTLDGFSTVTPFIVEFTQAIAADSINANAIHVYRVNIKIDDQAEIPTPLGPVWPDENNNAVYEKLVFGIDYEARVSPVDKNKSTLLITPLKPLMARANYLVVLTNDLHNQHHEAFYPDTAYALVKSETPLIETTDTMEIQSTVPVLSTESAIRMEGLRQLTSSYEGFAVGYETVVAGLTGQALAYEKPDIILSWAFTTQGVGDVLDEVKAMTPLQENSETTYQLSNLFGPFPAPINETITLRLMKASLDVPYFLSRASATNPIAPLSQQWQRNEAGELQVSEFLRIPVLIILPPENATKPEGGWPTVIFQHGITQNRTNALALGAALAQNPLSPQVVVAIDLPLHGIVEDTYGLAGDFERHLDMDYMNQAGAYEPDGVIDESGVHFINLRNLLVSRDNIRQAVSDLFHLTEALKQTSLDEDTVADLDISNNLSFVGHSLGSIVGTSFAAKENGLKSITLANGGGHVAKILDGSPTFGPIIQIGLARAAQIPKGSLDYERFLNAAQMILDPVDPINYVNQFDGRSVLFLQAMGDDKITNRVVDTATVPMTVGAPLAGNEPFATLMGLTQVDANAADVNGLRVWVKYENGSTHSSVLFDSDDISNTYQMQTQIGSFVVSLGTQLQFNPDINNVVEAPTEE